MVGSLRTGYRLKGMVDTAHARLVLGVATVKHTPPPPGDKALKGQHRSANVQVCRGAEVLALHLLLAVVSARRA